MTFDRDWKQLSSLMQHSARMKRLSHQACEPHEIKRNWFMSEWTMSTISDKASRALDEAITESVKILFDEIDKELQ